MLRNVKFLFLCFFIVTAAVQQAKASNQKALIYKGPGACESCTTSAAQMAQELGLLIEFVGPESDPKRVLPGAALWIQPGGRSLDVSAAMTQELRESIKPFVENGGRYVGFCAGGFLSTQTIRDDEAPAFDLILGRAYLWVSQAFDNTSIVPIRWNGKIRHLYFEGGPYFTSSDETPPENIVATYPDGKIASLRSPLGKGKVFVTGLHPEAPEMWRKYYNLTDPDGMDHDLAKEMLTWTLAN